MSLALVIPVWNDQLALDRLLRCARRLSLFEQIVVVDDGSDPPVSLAAHPGVHLLRHEHSRGPGAARNAALRAVTTDHLLFFDSDDLLADEFANLWRDVEAHDFDFCLFRHIDSRTMRNGRLGQIPSDDALWRRAGMGGRSVVDTTPTLAWHLAETANYPWNKIYRTDFLREQAIGCSEIMVHEDVELHWMSFIRARRILLSDRLAAVHYVADAGQRLTNRRGPERLDLFDPLSKIMQEFENDPASAAVFRIPFLRFISGLLDWIRCNLDEEHHAALDTAISEFFLRWLTPELHVEIHSNDPNLALKILMQTGDGKVTC